MSSPAPGAGDAFSYARLPVVNKDVFRMGIAGIYGIDSTDIEWAAGEGVNYWVWGRGFGKVTDGIKHIIAHDRERHVVAMLGWGYFGWQVRRSVEAALRTLRTDYLDVFKLGWLGRTSIYSRGIVDTLLELKHERKILSIGVSTHERKRAGALALDSDIDLFMIRYNAKHPGAEEDIFPHLSRRNPALIAYTALAWGQLTRPVRGMMPALSPELCYRFVLSNPNVHVVLTAPRNRQQLSQNLGAVGQGALDPDEMSRVRQYGRLLKSKKRLDYVH